MLLLLGAASVGMLREDFLPVLGAEHPRDRRSTVHDQPAEELLSDVQDRLIFQQPAFLQLEASTPEVPSRVSPSTPLSHTLTTGPPLRSLRGT